MHVMHSPDSFANLPVPRKNKKRLSVRRNTSLSHGGELSGAKGHCRILRSSSANTASTIPESKIKKRTIQTNSATYQLAPPLSQGLAGFSNTPHRQLSGSTVSTSSCRGTEIQNRPQHHTERTPEMYRSIILSSSDAREVLSQVRQPATSDTGYLGREPDIMDIILDLQSTVPDEDDAPLLRGSHRPRVQFPVYREYTFTDEQSLVVYWADQAAIWRGMRMIDSGATTTRFPDSDERSTASWDPSLNGSQSAD